MLSFLYKVSLPNIPLEVLLFLLMHVCEGVFFVEWKEGNTFHLLPCGKFLPVCKGTYSQPSRNDFQQSLLELKDILMMIKNGNGLEEVTSWVKLLKRSHHG